MRKITFLFLMFMMCGFAPAQSFLDDLEKIKQLKLLESTKEDAIKLLNNEDVGHSDSPDYNYSYFYIEDVYIKVNYSSGNCSDENSEWNVSKDVIVAMTLHPKSFTEIKDTGIDIRKYRRERLRRDYNLYVYHDKKAGVAVTIHDTSVEGITYFPAKESYSKLCDNPKLKKYYSSKRLVTDRSLYKATYHNFPVPDVTKLNISKTEIVKSSTSELKVEVSTEIINPMGDVIIYDYRISGGKIIGQGSRVTWDLSGVEKGTYKITAIADIGCGLCGKWKTRTVEIK